MDFNRHRRLIYGGLLPLAFVLAGASQAEAYIGPGAGLGMVGVLIAVTVTVLVIIFGLILYPIKLIRKRMASRKSQEKTQ